MLRYILRRVLQMVPVLFVISIATFLLMHVVVGDPTLLILGQDTSATQQNVDRLRQSLGLNRPLPVQYADWLRHVVVGDLGRSMRFPVSVRAAVGQRLPVTLELTFLALGLAILISLPLGVIAALRPGSRLDVGISAVAAVTLSVPNFWLGVVLIFVFALKLHLLPSSGYVPFTKSPLGNLRLMILPTITLATAYVGSFARYTRSSMLEVLDEDYVRTARAKGLTSGLVLRRHALRNALLPIVTVIGLELAGLFGGAVVTEIVFSLPGVGTLLTESILGRDVSMVQGIIVLITVAVVGVNLVADVVYGLLDPRIRGAYG